MGTAKRPSKQYKPPGKIWDKTRIDRDKALRKEYGFKNKKELWKEESLLRKIRKRARDLIGLKALGRGKEEEQEFIATLSKRGLVESNATIDNVLDLELKNIMDRRLQTMLYKKQMAISIKQARQMITHRHILVGEKLVDTPSYIVKRDEEGRIAFSPNSPLSAEKHPARVNNKGETS